METLEKIVNQKMDEVIFLLDQSNEMKRLVELKEQIKDNEEIRQERLVLLKEENRYDPAYLEKRVQFFQHPIVREYQELENDLLFFILEINQKLKKFLPERKGCQ